MAGGRRPVAGGPVAGGRWPVAGGRWLVAGGGGRWPVAGRWPEVAKLLSLTQRLFKYLFEQATALSQTYPFNKSFFRDENFRFQETLLVK